MLLQEDGFALLTEDGFTLLTEDEDVAAPFIEVDATKASRILQALRALREGRAIIRQELAAAVQMRDGDGTLASHYDVFAAKRGFVANDYADANTAAKAGYDELSSLDFVLNRAAGQGDAAGAALDQACAKFGV
jgi:hypothetical protein